MLALNPIETVFGRAAVTRLTQLLLLHFAGGFVGGTASCSAGSWDQLEPVTPEDSVLYLRASHPDWIIPGAYNQVRLYRNESGNLEMYVDQLYLRRDVAPRGLGTLTFWRMVRAAQLAGVAHIRLSAAGGRSAAPFFENQRWDGYRFWPSLGFDGLLTESDRTFFRAHFWDHPSGIYSATTIQEVLALADGKAFWKHCGGCVPECRFATAIDSAKLGQAKAPIIGTRTFGGTRWELDSIRISTNMTPPKRPKPLIVLCVGVLSVLVAARSLASHMNRS